MTYPADAPGWKCDATLLVPLALFAFAVLVRGRTFTFAIDDGDVGLYVLIAERWLHGALPYVDVWEYKPPGLFAAYALAIKIAGSEVAGLAWLGITATWATALATRAIARRLFATHGAAIGIVAACIVIVFSIEDDGTAVDAELLASAFTTLALAVVARCLAERATTRRSVALASVALACAVQMKLTAVPVALAAVVTMAYAARAAAARVAAAAAAIIAAPFALEAWYFAAAHRLAFFVDANVGATVRRIAARGAMQRNAIPRIAEQCRILRPLPEIALAAPFAFADAPADRTAGTFVAGWIAVEALGVAIVGEYDARQFVHLVAPLALLTAWIVVRLGTRIGKPAAIAAALAVVVFLDHGIYSSLKAVGAALAAIRHERLPATDYDRIVAGARATMHGDPSLFVVGYSPLVYAATDAAIPTRYAWTGFLAERATWPTTGRDGLDELRRVLATHPHTIVMQPLRAPLDPACGALLDAALARRYRLVGEAAGTRFYRRTDAGVRRRAQATRSMSNATSAAASTGRL